VRFRIKTLDAYRDLGEPMSLLKENVEQVSWVLSELSEIRIEFNEITNKLKNDGVEKFIASYDQLIKALILKSSV
jgi:hypothetical protein